MTDSSTFREIAEQSASEAEVQPQETSTEPSVASEAPAETTPKEETFAEDKDLTGMTPEELRNTKKEWEKAYTLKRQKETAEIKEYRRRIAELEQGVQSQPAVTQTVDERAQEAQRQVDRGQMTLDEYTDYMQSLMAEKARKVAREEYQAIHKEEKETQLQEKAVNDFTKSDPRFDDSSPEHDPKFKVEVQRELADLLDQHLAEHETYEGFDVSALTKQIVERRDKELDEIIKNRTKMSTQAAKMRDAKARKSEVRGSTSESQQVGGNTFRSILSDTLDGAA